MDEIKALKCKHLKTTVPELTELLRKHKERVNKIHNVHKQRIHENDKKIDELSYQISTVKEDLNSVNQVAERKNQQLSKYNDHIAQLEDERRKLLEENHILEMRKRNLETAKPSSSDQVILDDGKKRLKLYMDLTRIHWDYANLSTCVAGYVKNKIDYIKHFSYKEEDSVKRTDRLWHEIFLSTSNGIDDNDENKENTFAINIL